MYFKSAKQIDDEMSEREETNDYTGKVDGEKNKGEHIDENKNEKNSNFKLNERQKEAIKTTDGNLLIIASAGTGKTTTIVERYTNMVENHKYNPERILMTTFTNKAARDMENKIKEKTDKVSPWLGTMHSLFLKVLREETILDENFNLLTSKYEKKKIIKELLTKRNITPRTDLVTYILGRISKFKNAGVLHSELNPEEVKSLDDEESEELIDNDLITTNNKDKELGIRIYKDYQDYLGKNNLLDFDDILLLTLKLLKEDKKVREKYRNQFDALMIDEAQDLNVVQIRILNLLQENNLCLIGDDCQNIYEWRGSSNKLVFDFEKKHKKIILENNYRSTKKIIAAINRTIKSMNFKLDKNLKCTRIKGRDIFIRNFKDFNEELNSIAKEVEELIRRGELESEIAILFRTNKIGKQAERLFRSYRIPCHLTRSQGFFEREEVRDILSFLRLKINPNSQHNFERVANLLKGIGKKKIESAIGRSVEKKISLFESLERCGTVRNNPHLYSKVRKMKNLLNWENKTLDSYSKEDKGRNKPSRSISSKWKEKIKNPIKEFLDFFNYRDYLRNKYGDSLEKIEDKERNIELLLDLYSFKNNKEGLRNYLDSLLKLEKRDNGRKVTLSTIHSAKGLEWKHVFLICCNEKILPFYREDLHTTKRDEELRLFYVAISRSKDTLTITHSEKAGWIEQEPSRFLDIL